MGELLLLKPHIRGEKENRLGSTCQSKIAKLLALRVNLPLDEEAGAKLGLIFRLQERLIDLDRVELIARRVARFTREEALYWLSRTTSFEPDVNRWAVAGLRLMLGGQAQDPAVVRMLQRLREST